MGSGSIGKFISEAFKRGSGASRTLDFIIAPVLLLLVLLLPPVSITSRMGGKDVPKVASANTNVKVELLSGSPITGLQINKSADNKALPPLDDGLTAMSSLYQFSAQSPVPSEVRVTLPLQTNAQVGEELDVYSLNDTTWAWLTTTDPTADASSAVVETNGLPDNLLVVRTNIQSPAVAASLPTKSNLDATTKDSLAILNPQWHTVKSDGSLAGPLSDIPAGRFNVMPSIRNVTGDNFDGKILDTVFSTDASRANNVAKIAALADQNKYGGIDIDYQALNPNFKGQFSAFVSDLAAELHKAGRKLSVTVPAPTKSDAGWDTGAYDLSAIGQSADYVIVRPAISKSSYYKVLPQTLSYVTSQIDRRKVQLAVSTQSEDYGTSQVKSLAYKDALKLAAKVDIKQPAVLAPGKTLTFLAVNLLPDTGGSGIKWDGDAKSVTFGYKGDDGSHTVYIENAFSTAYRLQLAKQYNLRGVELESGDQVADSKIADLLKPYATDGSVQITEPNSSEFQPVWSASEGVVEDPNGTWTNWTIPPNDGNYSVSVSIGDGVNRVSDQKAISIMPQTTVASAAPTATATAKPNQPAPTTAPPTATRAAVSAPAPTTGKYPGVGYGFCVDPNNDPGRAFDLALRAGFSWAKIQIRWDSVETSKGNINWGQIDPIANLAAAKGMKLIFSFEGAPMWSRPGDTDRSVPGPPANPQDMADFVGAIAAREKGKVQAYEIGNEPNVWYEWGGHGNKLSAVQYVNLLKASYAAIKAQDPNAVVITAGLAPTGWNDGDTAYDDAIYLQMMYDAGVKNYSDAIGVHANVVMPYPATLAPGAKGDYGTWYFRRFEQLRAVMVRNGDSGKQMWFTEYGWPTSTTYLSQFQHATEISQQDQADWLVSGFQVAKADGYVGVMAVWDLNYGPSAEPDDFWAKLAFSVLNRDWTPRPAYNALAAMPK